MNRKVGQLARPDLERGHAEAVQQVGGGIIERRREELDPPLVCPALEPAPGLRRQGEPGQHLALAGAGLAGAALVFGRRGAGRGQGRRIEGLELHGVRADGRRGVDQPRRHHRVAVVVHARLGDHEHRPVADPPLADGDRADGPRRQHRLGGQQVVLLVDTDRALRGDRHPDRTARLDEPARPREVGGVDDVERPGEQSVVARGRLDQGAQDSLAIRRQVPGGWVRRRDARDGGAAGRPMPLDRLDDVGGLHQG